MTIDGHPLEQLRKQWWEEALAAWARPAYDLYPDSVAAEWGLPALDVRGGGSDFYGRVARHGREAK